MAKKFDLNLYNDGSIDILAVTEMDAAQPLTFDELVSLLQTIESHTGGATGNGAPPSHWQADANGYFFKVGGKADVWIEARSTANLKAATPEWEPVRLTREEAADLAAVLRHFANMAHAEVDNLIRESKWSVLGQMGPDERIKAAGIQLFANGSGDLSHAFLYFMRHYPDDVSGVCRDYRPALIRMMQEARRASEEERPSLLDHLGFDDVMWLDQIIGR